MKINDFECESFKKFQFKVDSHGDLEGVEPGGVSAATGGRTSGLMLQLVGHHILPVQAELAVAEKGP